MSVVDRSALLAILFGEPEHQAFRGVVTSGERCVVSAVNFHETATVLRARSGAAAVERLWLFVASVEMEMHITERGD